MDKIILVLKYIIVAIVQGVAEILPISSSGHMVIVQEIFDIKQSDLSFEIFLHFASLIAIVFFFRKKIWALIRDFVLYVFNKDRGEDAKRNFITCIYLVIATIPTAIVGLLLEDFIGEKLSNLLFVGIFLFVTAGLLYLSCKIERTKTLPETKWYNALFIGFFQCLGILPGISRSGSCIVGASVQKVKQADALEFAFLLALPVMLGSTILSIGDISVALSNSELIVPYLIAFLVTLITTYFSLKYFLKAVRKKKLSYFSIYCVIMGTVSIILYFTI